MPAKAKPVPTSPSAPPMSLAAWRKSHRPLRSINQELKDKLTPLQKLAVWITANVGTMGFFLLILGWTVLWLSWNLLAPKRYQFDPPMAFVFWLFISNMIQILLMPLIMVGQNIQGGYAEARAEHDLEVNIKAEEEIELVLSHLEYQNNILIQMLGKLDAKTTQALKGGDGGA